MKPHAVLLAAFATGLSGAMTPGPVLALVASEASRRGFVASPLIITGHALLELLLVGLMFVGLRRVLATRQAFIVLGLAGGGVLIWMGEEMVRQALQPGAGLNLSTAATQPVRLMLAGALVSLANPYWTVWWATVGTKLLQTVIGYGLAGAAIYWAGHVASDYVWYAIVGWLVSFRQQFWVGAPYRWLLGSCGALMLAMGAYFVFSGVRRLLTPIEGAADAPCIADHGTEDNEPCLKASD